MPVSVSSKTRRLSRQESKAQTRARLLTVGRQYFLLYGFKGATAEQISEEAGFTRGALHSNFEDKEGLFLAVIRESHHRRCEMFEDLIANYSGEEMMMKLREALADLVDDPDFLLWMEFELEALRNDKLRQGYLELSDEVTRDGRRIFDGIRRSSDVCFVMDGPDFVIIMTSLVRGLAARHALLGDSALSSSRARNMVYSVFGCNILHSGDESAMQRQP